MLSNKNKSAWLREARLAIVTGRVLSERDEKLLFKITVQIPSNKLSQQSNVSPEESGEESDFSPEELVRIQQIISEYHDGQRQNEEAARVDRDKNLRPSAFPPFSIIRESGQKVGKYTIYPGIFRGLSTEQQQKLLAFLKTDQELGVKRAGALWQEFQAQEAEIARLEAEAKETVQARKSRQ